ncbi:hypothetical protein ACFE04_029034 [Oxalis oulophora]
MEVERDSHSTANMMVEGSNLNIRKKDASCHAKRKRVLSTQKDHTETDTNEVSSNFRGVKLMPSGEWGAEIRFKSHVYILGTYKTKEEAALAYDRAALKLERNYLLNFPGKSDSEQELAFQESYTVEQILEMLKDKTYSSMLAAYMAMVLYGTQCREVSRPVEVSKNFLFTRELTNRDVTRGFRIPKNYALCHLPLLIDIKSKVNEGCSRNFMCYDKNFRQWNFNYGYSKSFKQFMFHKGWKIFAIAHNLKENDTISFFICKYKVDCGRSPFYMIDVGHRDANIGGSGSVGQGTGV